MTQEQLNTGKILESNIEILEKEKSKWERIKKIEYDELQFAYQQKVRTDFINFDVIKTLALKEIETQLTKNKTELEAL